MRTLKPTPRHIVKSGLPITYGEKFLDSIRDDHDSCIAKIQPSHRSRVHGLSVFPETFVETIASAARSQTAI